MEFVLVTKVTALIKLNLLYPSGFKTIDDRSGFDEMIESKSFFIERRWAEEDYDTKQIIPYTVVHDGDKYFVMERLKGGSESRLHNKMSIGVGGHINPIDNPKNILKDAAWRELTEELNLKQDYYLQRLGTINIDEDKVGKVHFGVVYITQIPMNDVSVRETDVLSGSWMTLDEIKALPNLENWSQAIINHLITRQSVVKT